jgi:hypothetical protein
MEARVARVLAQMHSADWKSRYGDEFEALLVDLPASPALIADVAGSIVASRRRPVLLGLGVLAILAAMLWGQPRRELQTAIMMAKPAVGLLATCLPPTLRVSKSKSACALG